MILADRDVQLKGNQLKNRSKINVAFSTKLSLHSVNERFSKSLSSIHFLSLFLIMVIILFSVQVSPAFGTHLVPQGTVADISDRFTINAEPLDESTILVSGHAPRTAKEPVVIKVTSPNGNLVSIDQLNVDSDLNYKTTIKTSKMWKVNGAYVIAAYQGPSTSANTGDMVGKGQLNNYVSTKVEAFDGMLAKFNLDYHITGGFVTNIEAEPGSNSLIISISTQVYNDDLEVYTGGMKGGVLTIELPRSVIDAKILETDFDDKFVVQVDGVESKYEEMQGSSMRTLEIPFPNGSEEIKVTGTFVNPEFAITVIPEFGFVAPLVLLASITAIVALSSKGKLIPYLKN